MLSKLVNVEEDRRLTENDLLTIVEEAEQGGGIDEQESELIRSAIEFNDVEVEEIATPRVDITAVPNDIDREALEEVFSHSGFMRLPVYEGSIDNIVGVIHLKDFYEKEAAGDHPAEEIMQPVLFITASMKIGALLKLLQKKKTHMAVVADEFGGTLGIVTIEDILEELVGEIWDEHDEEKQEISQTGDNTYDVDGLTNLEEFAERFGLTIDSDNVSVGGWVMEMLGRIPEPGDKFESGGLNVEVLETDGKRVSRVLVSVSAPGSAAQNE
jgi:CBS domain containing-hemolysin-like protein